MNKKRTLIFGLTIVALVAIFVVGVGTSYAQVGSRGARRGGSGNGYGAAQSDTRGQAGTNLQQQLQDPLLNDGTYGAQQRSGGQGQNGNGSLNGGLGASVYATMEPFTGVLPVEVSEAILAGLADEYNAMALYSAVIDQLGLVDPFAAIVNAEASHAAALETALTYYGVDFSTVAAVTPDVTFASVAEACATGAEAEIANVALYDSWLSAVSEYPDLVQIFTNLRNASEYSHLPIFQSCAG